MPRPASLPTASAAVPVTSPVTSRVTSQVTSQVTGRVTSQVTGRVAVGIIGAVVWVAAAAGCAEGASTPDQDRAELVDTLAGDLRTETDGALDEEAARCVAEGLVDGLGTERFEELVRDAAATPSGDATGSAGAANVTETVIDVFAACDALDAVVGLDITP